MSARAALRVRIASLTIASLPCLVSAATAQQGALAVPCRPLDVTNTGTETVWIGASGGSVVPLCQLPKGGQVCVAAPSLTANGNCACAASQPMIGTLVCPSGSTPTSNGQYCTCTPGADACGGSGATTACSGVASPNRCFWTLPNPKGTSSNLWQLTAGQTASFCISAPPNWGSSSAPAVSPIWWSGGVFARTGCQADGTSCATADCGSAANQNCPAGQGGTNPYTQAEFTLQSPAQDFYDVTVINGVNAVVVMAPMSSPAKSPPPGGTDADYWCAVPGSATASRGLRACSWQFDPVIPGGGGDQTTLLTLSSLPCSTANSPTGCPTGLQCSGAPGACFLACTQSSDCPGSLSCTNGYCQCGSSSACAGLGLPANHQSCGTQLVPGVGGSGMYQQLCGAFAGWWSAFDFCGGQVATVGPLACTASINDGNGTPTTLVNLLQCAGQNAPSCYNTTQGSTTCCGCATDKANALAKDWPPAAKGNECFGNDPTWASQVQPWLLYLKQGCPTAYSYPFDDATSTFQCQTTGAINMVGYTISLSTLKAPAAARK